MLYRIPEKLARSTSALSITMLNVSPVSVKFLRAMPTRQYQAPEAGGAQVAASVAAAPQGQAGRRTRVLAGREARRAGAAHLMSTAMRWSGLSTRAPAWTW